MSTTSREQDAGAENLHTKSPSYRALNRSLKEGKLPSDDQISRYLTEHQLTELPTRLQTQIDDLITILEQQAKTAEKDRKRKERMAQLRAVGQTTVNRAEVLQGVFNEGAYACGLANIMLNDLAAIDELTDKIPGYLYEPWNLKIQLWKKQFEARKFGELITRPRLVFLGDEKDNEIYQPHEQPQDLTEIDELRAQFQTENKPWTYVDNFMDFSLQSWRKLAVVAIDKGALEKLRASGPIPTGNSMEEELNTNANGPADSGEGENERTLATSPPAQPQMEEVNMEDYMEFIDYNPFDYGPYEPGTAAGCGEEIGKKEKSYATPGRPFKSFRLSQTTKLLDPWRRPGFHESTGNISHPESAGQSPEHLPSENAGLRPEHLSYEQQPSTPSSNAPQLVQQAAYPMYAQQDQHPMLSPEQFQQYWQGVQQRTANTGPWQQGQAYPFFGNNLAWPFGFQYAPPLPAQHPQPPPTPQQQSAPAPARRPPQPPPNG